MELTFLTSPTSAVLLPILIFFARVFDVTLGTVRIIFIARGKKFLAPLLGFVETFVWIVVVSQIVKSINGIWAFVGYAAGFAIADVEQVSDGRGTVPSPQTRRSAQARIQVPFITF
ncbi:MAG: DUF5698 domain-containing protein [Bellilinea sp.]